MESSAPTLTSTKIPEELTGVVYHAKFNKTGIETSEVVINEIFTTSYGRDKEWNTSWVVYSVNVKQIPKYHKLKKLLHMKSEIITELEEQPHSFYTSDYYSQFSPSGMLRLDHIGATQKQAILNLLDNK